MSEEFREEVIKFAYQCYAEQNDKFIALQFREDFAKFIYINRLVRHYMCGGDLKCRLVINYIIMIYNAFGHKITPVFFTTLDSQEERNLIYTYLSYFNRIPEDHILHINETTIDVRDCTIDRSIEDLIKESLI